MRITRRYFAMLSAASIGATVLPGTPSAAYEECCAEPAAIADRELRIPQSPVPSDDTLRSEFLFDLTLETQAPNIVGSPGGDRRIVGVLGGTFRGPRLRGTIISPGGDWIVQRPDGSSVLDVRIVMRTDDEQKIYATWRGIAYAESGGAIIARIAPMFETSSAKYGWLNNVLAVGVYRPAAGRVAYRVYRIL